MSFSFCLNKNEMLTLCGLSLLYQGLGLKQEGKLMQDGQRLVGVVVRFLEKSNAPGAADFRKLALSMNDLETQPKANSAKSPTNMNTPAPTSAKSMPSPQVPRQQLHPQLYARKTPPMTESDLLNQQEKLRRATLPNIAIPQQVHPHHGRTSMDSTRSESPMGPMTRREARSSNPQLPTMLKPRTTLIKHEKAPNLDYLSLSNTPAPSQPTSPSQARTQQQPQTTHTPIFPHVGPFNTKTSGVTPTEWEVLLGSLDGDGGQANLYDAIYGGPPLALADTTTSNYGDWSPESHWDIALNLNDFSTAGPARSVLSFSDESMTSGDELSTSDLGLQHDFRHSMLAGANSDSYLLEGLDATFGL